MEYHTFKILAPTSHVGSLYFLRHNSQDAPEVILTPRGGGLSDFEPVVENLGFQAGGWLAASRGALHRQDGSTEDGSRTDPPREAVALPGFHPTLDLQSTVINFQSNLVIF